MRRCRGEVEGYAEEPTCTRAVVVLGLFSSYGVPMSRGKQSRLELCEQASETDPKLFGLIQNFRPRICYVLSLLRIHRPDCEHCMARQSCGDELRKRLEELGWRTRPPSHENQEPRKLPRAG